MEVHLHWWGGDEVIKQLKGELNPLPDVKEVKKKKWFDNGMSAGIEIKNGEKKESEVQKVTEVEIEVIFL